MSYAVTSTQMRISVSILFWLALIGSPCSAQDFTQRGFVKLRSVVYPQSAPNDSGDVVAEPNFEKKPVQFLYRDGVSFNFMDLKDYNQFSIPEEKIKDISGYLSDSLEGIQSLIYNDEVIGIEIPPAVDVEIEDCPPPGMSKSATPRPKEARLKTGRNILVPDYISAGEIVRVNTQTGEFLQRVNKK